ncbi:hypothetical protein [Paludibacterium paludis]|nr:hypothetical protein [Paludibacterium paludis]
MASYLQTIPGSRTDARAREALPASNTQHAPPLARSPWQAMADASPRVAQLHAAQRLADARPSGIALNTDPGLEREADAMGAQAARAHAAVMPVQARAIRPDGAPPVQLAKISLTRQAPPNQQTYTSDTKSDHANHNPSLGRVFSASFTEGDITAPNNSTGKAGRHMSAILGPDHPLGAETSDSVMKNHPYIAYYKQQGTTLVKGHLLNANLGGPNHVANLYPITTQANALHRQGIEYVAKNWVNNHLLAVKYEVDATGPDSTSQISTFDCKLWSYNPTTGQTVGTPVTQTIESDPEHNSATESFPWRASGIHALPANQHKLAGYSRDDIEKPTDGAELEWFNDQESAEWLRDSSNEQRFYNANIHGCSHMMKARLLDAATLAFEDIDTIALRDGWSISAWNQALKAAEAYIATQPKAPPLGARVERVNYAKLLNEESDAESESEENQDAMSEDEISEGNVSGEYSDDWMSDTDD